MRADEYLVEMVESLKKENEELKSKVSENEGKKEVVEDSCSEKERPSEILSYGLTGTSAYRIWTVSVTSSWKYSTVQKDAFITDMEDMEEKTELLEKALNDDKTLDSLNWDEYSSKAKAYGIRETMCQQKVRFKEHTVYNCYWECDENFNVSSYKIDGETAFESYEEALASARKQARKEIARAVETLKAKRND